MGSLPPRPSTRPPEVLVSVFAALVSFLRPRLDQPTFEWFRGVLDATVAPFDPRVFRAEWSRAGRRLGSHPVTLTGEECELARGVGLQPFSGWGVDEVARAALLLRALAVAERGAHVPLAESLYLRGTIRERQALLRALCWLPEPARFADLAGQACRTHVVSVFEALAIGNPFAVRHLPRPIFDQMVFKAIALRVPPERIVGLSERVSGEVTRRPAGWAEAERAALAK